MRPCVLSRRGVSYAAPFPVLYPSGVGLCCTMKLYQSIAQTLPSGPTSARIGEVHSSSLAARFQALCDLKSVPSGCSVNVATRWPVGSATNAVLFQYCLGYVRAV